MGVRIGAWGLGGRGGVWGEEQGGRPRGRRWVGGVLLEGGQGGRIVLFGIGFGSRGVGRMGSCRRRRMCAVRGAEKVGQFAYKSIHTAVVVPNNPPHDARSPASEQLPEAEPKDHDPPLHPSLDQSPNLPTHRPSCARSPPLPTPQPAVHPSSPHPSA